MPVELVVRDIITSIITGVVVLGVAFSPIGRAFAERIIHGRVPRALPPADDPRVDDLIEAMGTLRDQLESTQERLDFAERLLAQAREKGQIAPGNGR